MNFLVNKNILVISPEAWGKSKVSKHHYAIALGQNNNRVWFLQPGNMKTYSSPGDPPEHIKLLEDHFTIPGLRKLSTFLRRPLVKMMIRKLERAAGVHFDVIWNFDNSRFFDLDCFSGSFTIHHCMDFHYQFQLPRASQSADLCLGVTDGIVANMKKWNQHAYFIHHGYSHSAFSNYKLPASALPGAVFVGNFMRNDIMWPWLQRVVREVPGFTYYFVGNYGISNLSRHIDREILDEIEKLKSLPNVIFTGELPPQDAYAAMHQADILFAAFNAEKHPEIFANLHKLMTYLAAGNPIVINRTKQFENEDGLMMMAGSADEFVAHFSALTDKSHKMYSEAQRKKRMDFAEDNTYQRQLERIDAIITQIRS